MNSNNSAHRLLTLIAMSGECSPDIISHMQIGQSYGKKLITRLKEENYIKSHYKDRLRGFRLTSRGKKILLRENPDRFLFYLNGNTDTNRPRSDYARRLRLQQSSIVYALLWRSGIQILRDRKPDLFQTEAVDGKRELLFPAFYQAREIKELGRETIKINNSRMMGILLVKDVIYVVYYTGDYLMKWERQTELRVKSMLQYHASRGILSKERIRSGYFSDIQIKALFVGTDMGTALKLMDSRGGTNKSQFCLDTSFEQFHFIPETREGELMLKLLYSPPLQKGLRNLLLSDLHPPSGQLGLEHDALKDGKPVLLAYDFDMLKLVRFATALSFHEMSGHVICFDFQKQVLEEYFAGQASFETIDLKKFEGRFLSENT